MDTDGQTYRFYDTLNNTEWLDFASTGFLPQSYALVNTATGETVAGMTLAVSPDAAPAQGGDVPGAQQTMPPEATGFVRAGAGTKRGRRPGRHVPAGRGRRRHRLPGSEIQRRHGGRCGSWCSLRTARAAMCKLGTVKLYLAGGIYRRHRPRRCRSRRCLRRRRALCARGRAPTVADGQGGMYQLGADAVGTANPDQAYNDGTRERCGFLVQFADGTQRLCAAGHGELYLAGRIYQRHGHAGAAADDACGGDGLMCARARARTWPTARAAWRSWARTPSAPPTRTRRTTTARGRCGSWCSLRTARSGYVQAGHGELYLAGRIYQRHGHAGAAADDRLRM